MLKLTESYDEAETLQKFFHYAANSDTVGGFSPCDLSGECVTTCWILFQTGFNSTYRKVMIRNGMERRRFAHGTLMCESRVKQDTSLCYESRTETIFTPQFSPLIYLHMYQCLLTSVAFRPPPSLSSPNPCLRVCSLITIPLTLIFYHCRSTVSSCGLAAIRNFFSFINCCLSATDSEWSLVGIRF